MNFRPTIISIVAIIWLSIGCANVYGQSELAAIIGNDAGKPAENYENYAKSLAKTLNGFTPEQLAEIFQGATPPGVTGGAEGGGDGGLATPEYEQALDDLLAAQAAFDAAETALADAQAALQSVLDDDAGLKSDGIPNNYGVALAAAQANVATAEEELEAALKAKNEAMALVEQLEEEAGVGGGDGDGT